MSQLSTALAAGWVKYCDLFGVPPRGTPKQLEAMLALCDLSAHNREVRAKELRAMAVKMRAELGFTNCYAALAFMEEQAKAIEKEEL